MPPHWAPSSVHSDVPHEMSLCPDGERQLFVWGQLNSLSRDQWIGSLFYLYPSAVQQLLSKKANLFPCILKSPWSARQAVVLLKLSILYLWMSQLLLPLIGFVLFFSLLRGLRLTSCWMALVSIKGRCIYGQNKCSLAQAVNQWHWEHVWAQCAWFCQGFSETLGLRLIDIHYP